LQDFNSLVSMAPTRFAGLFLDAPSGSLPQPFTVSIQAGPIRQRRIKW
jgi:hypothetical protein